MRWSAGHCIENMAMHMMHWNSVYRAMMTMSFKFAQTLRAPLKTACWTSLRKNSPHSLKVRADLEVTCFSYSGINAIREALIHGQRECVDVCPIQIRLIAPPMYVLTTMTLDKE